MSVHASVRRRELTLRIHREKSEGTAKLSTRSFVPDGELMLNNTQFRYLLLLMILAKKPHDKVLLSGVVYLGLLICQIKNKILGTVIFIWRDCFISL
jgi:hypothetical protein